MNITAIVILQAVSVIGTAQLITYFLMLFNFLYSVIIAVFIMPTYNDFKLIQKDYYNRVSPASLELQRIEKEKMVRYENDIKDILHKFNNLSMQISPLLVRMDSEPEMSEVVQLLNEIKIKLRDK